MARIRAVLFDIDGTLLDSNDAHAHAWLDALRGHGKNVPFELVRSKIGMGGDKLLQELAGIDPESLEGRAISERRTAVFKAHYLADLGPLPGARVLVDRVRSRGLATAVVTSANKSELADLLREAAVADLLETIISSDDADRSKPDPDLVEIAIDRLGVTASEAVMIGDTPYDVASAGRAGVACIAFRSGGWSDDDLEGAVAIYDGPAELAGRLDDSILARGLDDDERTRASSRRLRRAVMRGA
jgi:HAD superfamily hydrolase (TIGR01509 family)